MTRSLPVDAALPQLVQALDAHAMASVFAGLLDGTEVLGCEVDRVKYRPQRNCSVSYRLHLRTLQHLHGFEQRVSARFCHSGEAAPRHQRAAARGWTASPAGPGISHVPALDMLAHWLPNDPKLAALPLLCNDTKLRSHCLPEVVAALTGGRGRLVDHHTTLQQVVPELRVCARVALRIQPAPGLALTAHTLYAKADAQRSGAATQAVMHALSHSAAQAQGRLRTPQALLWQGLAGLHWQLAVPGMPLEDEDPQLGPASSARVGAQLAALHATPVAGLRSVGAEGLRTQVHGAVALLSRVEPAWQPMLARLAARLQSGAEALAGEPVVTLHGDLHPRNILVDGGQLAFIDLDGVHAGPAVLELGAWVADLLYRAALDGAAPDRALASGRAFLSAYSADGGRAVEHPLLAWSTAHDLLCKRAYRCVANLKPGRFEIVPQLLSLADAIAATGRLDAVLAPALELA